MHKIRMQSRSRMTEHIKIYILFQSKMDNESSTRAIVTEILGKTGILESFEYRIKRRNHTS